MCAFLQVSKIHIGTRYLKTTMREEGDLFLITQLHRQPNRVSNSYRGVRKAMEGSSRATKFSSLLGNLYSIWVSLSMSALTWLSPRNTCSDTSESSPCVRALGKRVAEGTERWESVLLCRIKYLPKQQEAAQSGTV